MICQTFLPQCHRNIREKTANLPPPLTPSEFSGVIAVDVFTGGGGRYARYTKKGLWMVMIGPWDISKIVISCISFYRQSYEY